MNYTRIIAGILLVFSGLTANAAERWIDVTGNYLNNAAFNSTDYSEWEVSGDAMSITVRVGCMEMWNGRINMEKTITNVPNGRYRLSVQGLYRTKDHNNAYNDHVSGTEDIRGFFFANDVEKPMACQYDWGFSYDPGSVCYQANGVYYPNSMEAAQAAFTLGAFQNELEFEVTDGTMVIGLYNDTYISDNWLVFDNFKIEQYVDVNEPVAGSLVINEIMAANVDMFFSPAYNFDSWIELYNPTDKDVWLGGCFLSDDPLNVEKWYMPNSIGSVPAHGFRTIWMGSNDINTNQGNFSLDCEGGELILSDPSGKQIDRMILPEAISRASYGRTTDGGTAWSWTAEPTPGETNATSTFTTMRLNAPSVTPDGQLFEGTLNIDVTIPSGSKLVYTTDGTTPTLTNGTTSITGRFSITSSKTYRFRLFADGMLPSPVVTRSYILKDHDYELPIISVTTKDEYLYDDMVGVYVKGTNGCTGNGQSTPANWNMEWNRPVSFQYLLPSTNTMAVSQEVDFSISGGWTRANEVKAFKLKADRVYEGLNAMDYQFFSNKPFNKNKTLQVRAGGNDSWCRIKDAAIQQIMLNAKINLDLISYQPAVHFINGVYKGIINVREPNNKDFAYANFGYSKDELEVYEQSPDSGAYMMIGTRDVLDRLVELSQTATEKTSYDEIKTLLDIDEYINYMAAELYLGSWDWPDNNVKAYREKDGGKYRFVIFDLDAAFGTDDRDTDENGNPIYKNTFRWIDGMQWHWFDWVYDTASRKYGEIRFCTFFLNMLNNDEFRRQFIDAFCMMGGSVFDADRADALLTQLGDRVRTTMSWEGKNPDGSLNEIKNALRGRMDGMTQDMIDYERLQLTDATPHHATILSNADGARLFVNNTEIPYSRFQGDLFQPATLKAVAPAGMRFTGWKKTSSSATNLFGYGAGWSYYDQGSLDGTGWTERTYDSSSWASGTAPLGYGKDLIATSIDYGTDASNKRPTYYFRKTVSLRSRPTANDIFTLNYVVDDGFVIYVNGTEAGRYGFSTSTINYDTWANNATGNPDRGTIKLDPSLFRIGNNTIAVEVHNNQGASTDIVWDAELNREVFDISNDMYDTAEETSMPTDETFSIMACFEQLTETERLDNGIKPIMVNEISAANSVYVNDYFKRNDWFELYNTTNEDIDVEGMYISDDPAKPQKCQISKGETNLSTIIPAHGFLTVWCDKLAPVNMLHASFKLAAEGGSVLITAKDGSWSDELKYEAHNGDETVGRYPDGSTKVYLMNMPTINDNNMYTTYMTEVNQGGESGISGQYVSNNNGLKISYAAGHLIVRSEQAKTAEVSVFTLSGQAVCKGHLGISSGRSELDISSLSEGCYIGRATDEEGNTVTCKFILTK